MSTLEKAIQIAANAHAGQTDKAGEPYILHPLRVMMTVATLEDRMAAVLHDVVEDTAVTLEDLRAQGFSVDVLSAIEALTKRKGETRPLAAQRARANRIARKVKLGDVADNMNLARIAHPTERDFARLREYEVVRAILLADDSIKDNS